MDDPGLLFLTCEGITKKFPGVVALNGVSIRIQRNMHALVGENGAGKTTLMRILSGFYKSDTGRICIEEKEVKFSDPTDATKNGILMVHQHSSLIGPLSPLENLAITRDFNRGLIPKLVEAEHTLLKMEDKLGFKLDLHKAVDTIPYEERQKIEILRALCCTIKLLILDEPTSMLTPQESNLLYSLLRRFMSEKIAILYSTHKLTEILDYADEVTVLRKGEVALSKPINKTTKQELVQAVVGDLNFDFSVPTVETDTSEVLLNIRELACNDDWGKTVLCGVSLNVRGGEILGVAGSSKSGKLELGEVIMGLRKASGGVVEAANINITNRKTRQIIRQGMAYVAPGANFVSIIPEYSVAENLILNTYEIAPFCKRNVLNIDCIRSHAEDCVKEFDIKTVSIDGLAKLLSGGNVQKLAIGREFSRKDLKALVLANPTAGLDFKTTNRIWRKIQALKKMKIAIVLISEDLNELKQLSDKIAILYEGRLVGVFPSSELPLNDIGSMMLSGIASKPGDKTDEIPAPR